MARVEIDVLGLHVERLSPEELSEYGLTNEGMALKVIAFPPTQLLSDGERARNRNAERSGIKVGDVIIEVDGGDYHLKPCFRAGVEFRAQDIRFKFPEGEFDLVFCRNLVFTYFEKHLQLEMLNKIVEKLKPAGFLIIGAHESLPECENRLLPYSGCQQIYQKVGRRPGGNSNRHATAFSETV